MPIYVGEAVTLVASAVNPVEGTVISDALAEAEFYAPGKRPKSVAADRTPDAGPVVLAFVDSFVNRDGSIGAYIGTVDTAGWTPGRWSYKATFSGVFDSWEYGTFTLVA